MAEWDGNESSCACDCGFDIPKGGCLDALNVKDISGIANMIYPVGSVYMSVNSADPSTLFGGTWERIEDVFLLASGSIHAAGTTGGSESHKHTSPVGYNTSNNAFGISYKQGSYTTTVNGEYASTGDKVTTGSGSYSWKLPTTSTDSNMPPFLAVYAWKRTA